MANTCSLLLGVQEAVISQAGWYETIQGLVSAAGTPLRALTFKAGFDGAVRETVLTSHEDAVVGKAVVWLFDCEKKKNGLMTWHAEEFSAWLAGQLRFARKVRSPV